MVNIKEIIKTHNQTIPFGKKDEDTQIEMICETVKKEAQKELLEDLQHKAIKFEEHKIGLYIEELLKNKES